MALSYLLVGSNSGSRHTEIEKAIGLIRERIGKINQMSSWYETEPWGFISETHFLNIALCVETDLSPVSLMDSIIQIETDAGRIRSNNKGYRSRIIDIDVLFYSNEVINTESIKIPHPLLHLRKFVLTPLKEIAPSYIHPVLNKSVLDLFEECNDTLTVKKFTNE